MNCELQMAYDLLHQVQCLPAKDRENHRVDKVQTIFTLEERAYKLVRYLEENNQKMGGCYEEN